MSDLDKLPTLVLPDPWPADDPDDDLDEVPVCSNGSEDCAAAEDNWCCSECWQDRKDDAAIDAEDARQGR